MHAAAARGNLRGRGRKGPPVKKTLFVACCACAGLAIYWEPAQPTTIPNQPALDYWLPQATIHAVRVLFAVAPAHPGDITSSPVRIGQFAAFLRQLATTYPIVKDYVIGNEPNQWRFWQPQFTNTGAGASGVAYEPL